VIRALVIAVGLLAVASPVHAEPLAIEHVLASLPHHPLVRAAATGVERAAGEQQVAAGAFDLRLRARGEHAPVGYYDRLVVDGEVRALTPVRGASVYAGWRRGTGGVPDYDLKVATLGLGELRAGFEIPLLRDGAIDRARADQRKAAATGLFARAELGRRELELARDATTAYWDWVTAGQRLEVRTRQLALARDRDRGIQRTIEQGNLAVVEGVDNRRVIAQRDAAVAGARRDLERAALELSLWWRDEAGGRQLPSSDLLPPLAELPPPLPEETDLGSAVADVRSRHPIARALAARLTSNAVDLELADNQLLPSLSVTGRATRGLGDPDPRIPDRSTTALDVGVVFEVPLQRRQAAGSLAIARADRARLEAERRFAPARLEGDLRAAAADLAAARTRAELAAEQERLARSLVEAEQRRFEQGEATILVVNLREEAAADAAIARIDALGELWKARARFALALGRAPG